MPVTQYKKVEKEFADRLGSWLRRLWVSIGNFFRYIMVKGKQRFTVMLIPHSEKKIFNFQISFFTLIFLTCTIGIILVGFFLLATNFTYINEQNVTLTQERDLNEKTLTSLRDEIAALRTAGKGFKTNLDKVTALIESQDTSTIAGAGVVAASFSLSPENPSASTTDRDLSDLRSMTSLLKSSTDPLVGINKILSTYKDLLANTPTFWPLKGVRGNITTKFGWTTNPFTKVGYMHTGIDIAWIEGTPVVATADGTVIQRGWTEDLGYNVTIQHKYGFYTRYAHLIRFANKNYLDKVQRGDIIGYVGSTGLSTGPHLHYEVRLGAQYINPLNFLEITPGNGSSMTVGTRSSD